MDFGKLVEQKIGEAIARGESKILPGAGKPVKIENLYFLPPEFKFAYTVLKNSGYLNLADNVNAPVISTSDDLNLPNSYKSTKAIQEKTSVSLASDEIISSNVKSSNPTKNIQEKGLKYNVMRDSRRRKF